MHFQVECVTQFVLGVYDNGGYIDSFSVIAWRSVTSVTGFWFDCVTSIPWSCIDLHLYLVRHYVALCTLCAQPGGVHKCACH